MKLFFSIVLFLIAFATQAQTVYYTDVNPDSCVCITATTPLTQNLNSYWDLDHNGTYDFIITSSVSFQDCMHGYESTYINAYPGNRIAGDSNVCPSTILAGNIARKYYSGDSIHSSITWLRSTYLFDLDNFNGICNQNNWICWPCPNDTGYVGVKFYADTILYCGWIRLLTSVSCGTAKVKVFDYAYHICSGDFPAAEVILTNKGLISIFPNPSSGIFTVQSEEEISSVEAFDMLGRSVFSQPINHLTNLLIDLSSKAKGIYSLKIISEEKITVKKVIIN